MTRVIAMACSIRRVGYALPCVERRWGRNAILEDMSNLIREKRLDKNGVLVTRHVRASKESAVVKSLPIPTVQSLGNKAEVRFSPSAEQLASKRVEITGPHAIVSSDLNKALKRRSRPMDFTASDVEAYDVLSVVDAFNAAALLSHGITSSGQARAWLSEKGLDYLLADNAEFAEQALQRRIPADVYFDLRMKQSCYRVPGSVMLDAAEVMMTTVEDNPVWEDVLDGSIRMEDVRKIGPERLGWGGLPRTSNYMREFLKALKTEGLDLEDEQLHDLLLDERKVTYGVDKGPALVSKFGCEQTVSFHSYGAAHSMWGYVKGGDDEYVIPRVTFFDDMARVCDELRASGVQDGKLGWNGFQWAKVNQWYEAGLTPQEAVDCHRGATSMERVLAVREAINEVGVSPSVSSGWL